MEGALLLAARNGRFRRRRQSAVPACERGRAAHSASRQHSGSLHRLRSFLRRERAQRLPEKACRKEGRKRELETNASWSESQSE